MTHSNSNTSEFDSERCIGVTGGSNEALLDEYTQNLCRHLGQEIMQRGYTLVTTDALGVERLAAEGAMDFLTSEGEEPAGRIVSFVAPGRTSHGIGETRYLEGDYDERSRERLRQAKVWILIAGESGTERKYTLALRLGIPVLPIGCSGGTAAVAWQELSQRRHDYYRHRIQNNEFEPLNNRLLSPQQVAQQAVTLAERFMSQSSEPTKRFHLGNRQITVVSGNIADLSVDILVNREDVSLSMSGGVARAILEKGGLQIREELRQSPPPALGDVIRTGAGNLAAKHVLHAIVVGLTPFSLEVVLPKIAEATERCLRMASEVSADSIAFPVLTYGRPSPVLIEGIETLVKTVCRVLPTLPTPRRVIFCIARATVPTFARVLESQPETSADPIILKPTLVIGLGGAGATVVDKLKQRIREEIGEAPWIQFRVFDIDLERLRTKEALEYHEFGYLGGFSPAEAVRLIERAPHTAPELRGWYQGMEDKICNQGAAGIRPLGRLALLYHLNKVRSVIEQAMHILNSADVRHAALASNCQLLDNCEAYVISSLGGGTGSGIFLDIAYLTRYLEKSLTRAIKINGILMLPTAFEYRSHHSPELHAANTYAALKELDYLMDKGALEERYPEFTLSLNERPFDNCYLLDSVKEGGYGLKNAEELFEMVAEALFGRLTVSETTLESLHANISVPPFQRRFSEKFAGYSTFGVSSLVVPVRTIQQTCAFLLSKDAIESLLAPPDGAESIIQSHKKALLATCRSSESTSAAIRNLIGESQFSHRWTSIEGEVRQAKWREVPSRLRNFMQKILNDEGFFQSIQRLGDELTLRSIEQLNQNAHQLLGLESASISTAQKFLSEVSYSIDELRQQLEVDYRSADNERTKIGSEIDLLLMEIERQATSWLGRFRSSRIKELANRCIDLILEQGRYSALMQAGRVRQKTYESLNRKTDEWKHTLDSFRDKLQQVQGQKNYAESYRSSGTRQMLGSKDDIYRIYRAVITDTRSEVSRLRKNCPPVSEWLDKTPEQIQQILSEAAKIRFASFNLNLIREFVEKIGTPQNIFESIGEVADVGRSWAGRIRALIEMGRPFLQTMFPPNLQTEEILLAMSGQSISADIESVLRELGMQATLLTTPGESGVVFYRERHGFPLFALKEIQRYKESYEWMKTQIALHLKRDWETLLSQPTLDLIPLPQTHPYRRIRNPYVVGPAVRQKEVFFGREDVFSFLREHFQGEYQDNIIILQGKRRTGKSSVLLQVVEQDILTPYIPVYIDLQGVGDVTTQMFLEKLGRAIREVLNQRGYNFTMDVAISDAAPFNDFNKFLDEVEQALGENHIILMFDEFEELERHVEKGRVSESIFPYLRSLMQHRHRVNFILSGSQMIAEMRRDYMSILFQIAIYHQISFLTPAAARQLITLPVKEAVEFDSLAVERILRLTGCHPYFLQLTCFCLVNYLNVEKRNYVVVGDVNAVVPTVLQQGTGQFDFEWQTAKNETAHLLLSALASGLSDSERYLPMRDLKTILKKPERDIPTATLLETLRGLERDEILESISRLYRFRVDLFRNWIKNEHPFERMKMEVET